MKDLNTQHRIDQIIAEIKAEESARREKLLISLAVSISALLFVFVSCVVLKEAPKTDEIRKEQMSILTQDDYAPGETSGGQKVYIQEEIRDLPDVSNTEEADSERNSEKIEVDVEGELLSASKLTFLIVNYDPDYIYRVDFGNGEGKIIEKSFEYSYDEAGVYVIKITAYGKNNHKKKVTIPIGIKNWENALHELEEGSKQLSVK